MQGHRASVEPASSNSVRNVILARHEALRGLVTQTVHLAEREPSVKVGARKQVDALRTQARKLYLTLDAELTFEARAFPVALRDLIGWGSVVQEQIEELHARQRRALARALAGLEPETVSWNALATDVLAIAASVLRDFDSEEAALLDADIDAVFVDGEGG